MEYKIFLWTVAFILCRNDTSFALNLSTESCETGKFGRNCSLACHCATGDVCDTNGDCPNDCEESWAGPKCQIQLENVAEGKKADQKPKTKAGNEARFAVDGIEDQKANYSHAISRELNGSVWWEVNLGTLKKIHSIKVYFAETDGYEKKLRGVSLGTSNSSHPYAEEDLCYKDNSGPDDTPLTILTLSNCYSGSYVRLYNSRNESLDSTFFSKYAHLLITEVQVIAEKGCARGIYGAECENVCGHCKNGVCKREDGTCGECLSGWYGGHCKQPCSSYCSFTTCLKFTGDCIEECQPGFYGKYCNDTCRTDCLDGCERIGGKCNSCQIFRYGTFCEQECNKGCHTCSLRLCHRDYGYCLCQCKDRFYGDMCDQSCPPKCIQCDNFTSCSSCEKRTWGKRCEKQCSNNCKNQECDRISGKCNRCNGYRYGDTCNIECPGNCDDGLCHQTGTCQQGCKDLSFHGDKCDIPCSDRIPRCKECQLGDTGDLECLSCTDGKYGSACKQQCPGNCVNCHNGSLCTHCKVGFTGATCETVCSVKNCSECNTNGTCRICIAGRYGHSCEYECPDCETCALDNPSSGTATCLTCRKGKFVSHRSTTIGLRIDCEANCDMCVSKTNCTSCTDGYYGANCSSRCPDSCQSCVSDTECTSCKTKWTGSICQCNMNHCIMDSEQSKWCAADGTCLKGCIKGFGGPKCKNKCMVNCLECEQHSSKCLDCAAGLYGPTCHQKCSINCAKKDISGTSICKFDDGSCSLCVNGWYGPRCDKPCNPNCLNAGNVNACFQKDGTCERCQGDKHGSSCELDCAANCYDRNGVNSCYQSNGSCVSCADGYYSVYCNVSCNVNCTVSCEQVSGDCNECKSGFYGRHCTDPCPSNCGEGEHSRMIVCNRFSGECLFCKEGFHGEICNFSCSEFCTVGVHKPVCEKAGGQCLACQPGHHGHFCEDKCNENCGIEVGSDFHIGLCDRNISNCLHGCKKGWYNRTCLDKCNSKCRREICDFEDGKCTDGCVSGYTGVFCSLMVPPDEPATAGIIVGIIVALLFVAIIVILLFFIRRKYLGRQVRKGTNTRVHKRFVKNGITPDEIIPLHANVNGANSLPLPARNTIKATVEDEVLNDGDETTHPLMGSELKASDYYNLNSLIPVAGFADYVHGRQAANVDWYKDDFAKIHTGLLKNCIVAVSPANRAKCRYKNLYPYDDTRVVLGPDGNEKTDFINASYIHGYQQKNAFIAAQGPTEQNLNDFWRMIWQMDCGKIVMLTNLYEDCKIKCVKYWPDENEKEQYGNLEVEKMGEDFFSDYTLRHLKASHKFTKEEKDFVHFHFTAWPDRGVPENAGSMLHFRDKVNEAEGVPDGPILVHCSAGIGRTGTFIVTDYLIRQAKAESHLDVFRTVTDMRYQRANFVQTDIQYEFVHKALVEALTTKEMEIAAPDFCHYYWDLLEDRSEYSNQTKFEEQYETLNEMSASLDESCFTSGHLPENITKNRFPDIVPVDTYRAYLSTPVKGSNEYINAVFLPTCLNKSAFLQTQMPLPHTVTDFWRLVYDQHVSTIVMMNNINDNDETVGEYWPSEDSTYGPFKVELLSCENHEHYSIMAMKLTYTSSSRQDGMTVRQYRFESWPDGELVPASTKPLVSLSEAVNQSPKVYKDEPVIVHCMNGNDRSGLFCTVSAIIAQLRTQQKVNIPQTILQLRRRRPQLIPNLEQYDFCHKAVSEHLDDAQIYSNVM